MYQRRRILVIVTIAAAVAFVLDKAVSALVFEPLQKISQETTKTEAEIKKANTVLNTEVKTTFVIANYQYSFIKNEKMEVAGLLGLYTAQFRFKFGATQPLVDIDRKTTAPLPVLRFHALAAPMPVPSCRYHWST